MNSLWIRKFGRLALVALGSATIASAAGAQNFTLDFAGLGPGNGTVIPATYGDQPGLVDVTIRHRSEWGLGGTTFGSGFFWANNYNDLVNVAYTNPGGGVGEILLDNLATDPITLNFADVGAWSNRTATVALRVYDLAGNLLFFNFGNTVGGPVTANNQHVHFVPGVNALDGLLVQFSQINLNNCPTSPLQCPGIDAYNVGIDNVNFTIGPLQTPGVIPEPSTYALIASGLAATGLAARRRRAR